MKRRYIGGILKITVLLAAALLTGAAAAGQAKITTMKFRLADFTDKVTKVVLSGNEMMDSALKLDVADHWTASPFEFCTAAEFEKLKKSDKYYFLLTAIGKAGKSNASGKTGESDASRKAEATGGAGKAGKTGKADAAGATAAGEKDDSAAAGADRGGLVFLALVKGGKTDGGNRKGDRQGLEDVLTVVSVPFGAAGGFGRELVFLPALLDIVQDFTLQAMQSEMSGYSGLGQYNANYRKDGRIKRICFAQEDFAPSIDAVRMGRLDEDILIVPEEEADEVFQNGTFNTLVSFVVAPEDPQPGDTCFKMLIDAETHRLYYFKSHVITGDKGRGFLPKDLRTISRRR